MKRLSLRVRLTLLTAILLTVASVVLTITSMFTAKYIFHINSEGILEENIIRERRFNYYGFGAMIIVIISGTVAAYFIAGKALKPATELSKEIEERDENNLFSPLDFYNTNDEVSRIADSFNKMISKLENAFNIQKRFSANAAHELRTPLSSMITAIEVLKIDDSQDLQEHKEVLDDVYNNSMRLKTLIDNLLKLNTSIDTANFTVFDIKETFGMIISELETEAKKKKIQINNISQACTINGDKELLHRAFYNVLHNAIRYNKTGGNVNISFDAVTENNTPYVRLNIKDSGIGVKEEDYEKVFEPFYCVDKSRSRESGGNGLGLSLVKIIIEKHGGNTSINSIYGQYTEVKIILPLNPI